MNINNNNQQMIHPLVRTVLSALIIFNAIFTVSGLQAARQFDGMPHNKIETDVPALLSWTNKTLNEAFNAQKMVAVAWEGNKEMIKNIWDGMDQDFNRVKTFLKDNVDAEKAPFIKSLKRFKEYSTSNFMHKDLANFELSKSLWSRFAKTDLVRVSEIFDYESQQRQTIRETANSDIEKYSFITLRAMWLVTKEGLYLVIGLPALATTYSGLSVLELSWKIASRSFATVFKIGDVAYSLFANLVYPVLSPAYPFLSFAFRGLSTVAVGTYQVVYSTVLYAGKAVRQASVLFVSANLLVAAGIWQLFKFTFYTGPMLLSGSRQFDFYFPLEQQITEQKLCELLNNDFSKEKIVERGYNPNSPLFFMPGELDGSNAQKFYLYHGNDSIQIGKIRLTKRWGQYVVQIETSKSQIAKVIKKFPFAKDQENIFATLKNLLAQYGSYFPEGSQEPLPSEEGKLVPVADTNQVLRAVSAG